MSAWIRDWHGLNCLPVFSEVCVRNLCSPSPSSNLFHIVMIVSVTGIIVRFISLRSTIWVILNSFLALRLRFKILGSLISANLQNVQNLITPHCGCCQQIWGRVHHTSVWAPLVCSCILASLLSHTRVRSMFLKRQARLSAGDCPTLKNIVYSPCWLRRPASVNCACLSLPILLTIAVRSHGLSPCCCSFCFVFVLF